jgi:hypothetical protein
MKRYTLEALDKTGKWVKLGSKLTREQMKLLIFRKRLEGYHSFMETSGKQSKEVTFNFYVTKNII